MVIDEKINESIENITNDDFWVRHYAIARLGETRSREFTLL